MTSFVAYRTEELLEREEEDEQETLILTNAQQKNLKSQAELKRVSQDKVRPLECSDDDSLPLQTGSSGLSIN